ncbi:glycosyltransferase [Candidatus Woesearchaeota archaeon]|nr:glycosyltransferase [Candidatus Woesearchaeota archaeon]
MIAKNEEKLMEQCLNSVKDIADEIIIVDTGSTDKTKEIAKKYDTKIFDFKWIDDFSAARNESIRYATKDWILVMDADEVIEKHDLAKIKELIENAKDIAGFSLEQRSYLNNFFEGAAKNSSDFGLVKDYPFYISHHLVRLFKNKLGFYFKHKVHELVEDSLNEKNLKYKKTDIVLHHFGSLKDENLISGKTEQYSKIILKQLEEEPESARYNYQAARMHIGRNDFSNALKHFEKAAKIDPGYKLVFSEIAKIYMQMNDKNRAIEYFKKSMKQNPGNPSPANNLAVVYMSMGKFEQAKKIIEEQLKKHPENKALKYNYGECLKNIKK